MQNVTQKHVTHSPRLLLGLCAAGLATLTVGLAAPARAAAPEWISHFGSPSQYDSPSQVVTDSHDNVIVVGTTSRDNTSEDIRVVKYDPSGKLLWTQRYNGPSNGNDAAAAVGVDAADNVYVTGVSTLSLSESDFVTLKYSPTGTPLWRERFGSRDTDSLPIALKVTPAGEVYVTGDVESSSAPTAIYTLKYDTNGHKLWGRRFDAGFNHASPAKENYVEALALDKAGNAYITGEVVFVDPATGYYTDAAVTTKYLPDGTRAWTQRYSDPSRYNGNVTSRAVAVDPDGDIIVGDTDTESSDDFSAAFFLVFKYSPDGSLIWKSPVQFAGNVSFLQALSVDSAGSVVAAGYSGHDDGSGQYPDYYFAIAKLDSGGNQVWDVTSSALYNRRVHLALDAAGNAFLSGTSSPDDSFSTDTGVTQKYAAADGSLLWSDTQSVGLFDDSQGVTTDSTGAALVILSEPDTTYNDPNPYSGQNADWATLKYAP